VTAIGAALPRVPHRELVAQGRELDAFGFDELWLIEAGADAVVVSPVGDDSCAQLQRFAAEALPLLRS
jgi:hypothetical protein